MNGVLGNANRTTERPELSCYLFIYLVQDPASGIRRFCTVVSYGRTLERAEQVAINRVHQQHLHIVRTDTATPAPWLDPSQDGIYLDELVRVGSALQMHQAVA